MLQVFSARDSTGHLQFFLGLEISVAGWSWSATGGGTRQLLLDVDCFPCLVGLDGFLLGVMWLNHEDGRWFVEFVAGLARFPITLVECVVLVYFSLRISFVVEIWQQPHGQPALIAAMTLPLFRISGRITLWSWRTGKSDRYVFDVKMEHEPYVKCQDKRRDLNDLDNPRWVSSLQKTDMCL